MGHQMGHLKAAMITDVNQGLRAVSAKPLVRVAEARGFEPRMGANPNRISSPFAAPKGPVILRRQPQSTQVSGVAPGKATEAVAGRRNASWAINGPSQTLLQPHPRSSATARPALRERAMSANKSRRKRPATAAEREHGDQERRERLA